MKLLLKCNIVLPVIVTGLILYIGFSGCSGNVDVKAPYALKESIDINIPTSTFNLPVSYSIKDQSQNPSKFWKQREIFSVA